MPQGVTICNVKPKWKESVPQKCAALASLLSEFAEIFAVKPGTITGHKAVVHLNEGAVLKPLLSSSHTVSHVKGSGR